MSIQEFGTIENHGPDDIARIAAELFEAERSEMVTECEKTRSVHPNHTETGKRIDGLIEVIGRLVESGSQSVRLAADLRNLGDELKDFEVEPEEAAGEIHAVSARVDELTDQSTEAAKALTRILADLIKQPTEQEEQRLCHIN